MINSVGGVRNQVCRVREGTYGGIDGSGTFNRNGCDQEAIVARTARRDTESKAATPQSDAPWELRVGKLRVFYEVTPGGPAVVRVLAVGKKGQNILRIAGREIKL